VADGAHACVNAGFDVLELHVYTQARGTPAIRCDDGRLVVSLTDEGAERFVASIEVPSAFDGAAARCDHQYDHLVVSIPPREAWSW
jgi:hypothetical protein